MENQSETASLVEEPSFASQNTNNDAKRLAWKEALDRLTITCKLPELLQICRDREWSDVGVKPLCELSTDLSQANLFLRGEDLNEAMNKREVVEIWNEYVDSGELGKDMRTWC